ncbi:DoxX family protein [Plantibacter sp. YIM 135249]|uniref:DoxX family protein n=1 Tax=Plantibacter sp. YIM 135249 TaxID=3423918 RepID=UPI003D341EDB
MSPFSIVPLVLVIALAAVFLVMGVGHFLPGPKRTMAAMIPPRLRSDRITPAALVAFTGVCEIAGGIGLLVPATRLAAVICLIVFLVAVFPANAYAAKHREKFGALATPFVPRLIGQLVLIAALVVTVI